MSPNPDRRAHKELLVADMLEQTGSYIKYGGTDNYPRGVRRLMNETEWRELGS